MESIWVLITYSELAHHVRYLAVQTSSVYCVHKFSQQTSRKRLDKYFSEPSSIPWLVGTFLILFMNFLHCWWDFYNKTQYESILMIASWLVSREFFVLRKTAWDLAALLSVLGPTANEEIKCHSIRAKLHQQITLLQSILLIVAHFAWSPFSLRIFVSVLLVGGALGYYVRPSHWRHLFCIAEQRAGDQRNAMATRPLNFVVTALVLYSGETNSLKLSWKVLRYKERSKECYIEPGIFY